MTFGFLRGLRVSELLNAQSLAIVLGGTVVVLWYGFPTERLRQTAAAVRTALTRGTPPRTDEILSEILELARVYRTHGPLALEKASASAENDFLRFGATLIAEGYKEAALNTALEREGLLRNSERAGQIRVLRTLTRLTPALGMAGTVISLMQVLRDLQQPDQVGASLGLALSSTLYGVLLANLFFLPLASKLEELAQSETIERSMIIEALRGVQAMDHPLRIAERLNAYELYLALRREGDTALAECLKTGAMAEEAAGEVTP
jgi:chemotaxis protein MotA